MKAIRQFQNYNAIMPTNINVNANPTTSVTANVTTLPYVTGKSSNKSPNNNTTPSFNVTQSLVGETRNHVIYDVNDTTKEQNHVPSMPSYLSSEKFHLSNTLRHVISSKTHELVHANKQMVEIKSHSTNETPDGKNHVMNENNDVRGHVINSTNRIEAKQGYMVNDTDPGLYEVFNNIHDSDDGDADADNHNEDDNDNDTESNDKYDKTDSRKPATDDKPIITSTDPLVNKSTNTNVTYIDTHSGNEMALSSDTSNHEQNITNFMKSVKDTSSASRSSKNADLITQSNVPPSPRLPIGLEHAKPAFSNTGENNPDTKSNVINLDAEDGSWMSESLQRSELTKAIQEQTKNEYLDNNNNNNKLQEPKEKGRIPQTDISKISGANSENMNLNEQDNDALIQSFLETSGSASYEDIEGMNSGKRKNTNLTSIQTDTMHETQVTPKQLLVDTSYISTPSQGAMKKTNETTNDVTSTAYSKSTRNFNLAPLYENMQTRKRSDVKRFHSNKSDGFYNGVVLRRGLVKLPLAARNQGSQSLEEYIDEI